MKFLLNSKRLLPILLLLIVELSLFFTNYTQGTYFLGWDNLFPEANLSENIKRSFFAIWQEYRGLGLLDGMSYAANLPHYLFLSIIYFFLPHSLIRYFFIFLMHFLGGVGVYFLLDELLNNGLYKKIVSFLGSLFYLLNIATVQMFFAPYEVFTVHFAFLPFLLLSAIKYLRDGTKRKLFCFALFSFLAIPQAHVPTIFLVYLIALLTISGFYLLSPKRITKKRIIIILFLTFIVNSYWGLPYVYSALNNAKIIVNSKINQMSTEEVYLKNKAYGDFLNVSLLKGYGLDFIDIKNLEGDGYMMGAWKEHSQKPFFVLIGLSFFALALVGLIKTIIKKKSKFYPFTALFIFAFLMLGNDIPLLSVFSLLLNKYIPYFFQVFRFTFTKFSIIYTLSFAVLFAFGLSVIFERFKKSKIAVGILTLFLISLLGYYSFPSFQGQFLYKKLQIKIPNDYFELTKYFKKQNKSGRIATLPQPSFWGWTYTKWGYRGSGFIWYGLPQASLDGAFYPWSDKNENYYWEISYALYSQNLQLFERVLEKYQVNWLLVDGNAINPSSPKALYLDELEEMLTNSEKIALVQQFGKIKIYQVNLETPVKDYVFLAENIPIIGPEYNWNNLDSASSEFGHYISSPTAHLSLPTPHYYFPFRSLFTGRSQEDLEFEVEEKEFHYIFRQAIPEELKDYHLEIPEITKEELIWVDPNDLSRVRYLQPEVHFDGKVVEAIVPKVGGYYSAQIEPSRDPEVQTAKNCNPFSKGVVKNEIVEENGKKFLRLTAIDANNCSPSFWLPNLPHKYAYLITVESRNLTGKNLLFWLENLNIRKADLETYLSGKISYFVQPPMGKDGLGYMLHFDNISIGREKTVNDLGKIVINPIPFNFLTSLKLVPPQLTNIDKEPKITLPIEVSHSNPSFYQVTLGPSDSSQTLVLSQSFHQGWLAFKVKGLSIERIKDHVLVNNWANGWVLENSHSIAHNSQLYLIFLPQLLEYFGFLLLFLFGCFTLIFLLK